MADTPVAGQSQGIFQSLGNFLGGSQAPSLASATYYGNQPLTDQQNYASGMMTNPNQGAVDQQMTGSDTGTQAATQGVQGNSILMGGLNGMQGQLQTGQDLQGQQTGILNGLQNQGYTLTPGDNSLYGQASGNIARQMGQQGNMAAAGLANSGMSASGAAGATFSGLAGNQNEMLNTAQQQIMQQRFQNTMSQIGQQQSFINSLNSQNNNAAGNVASQGASDINQQYGRQLAGSQNTASNLNAATSQTLNDNSNKLSQYQTITGNTPQSMGDYIDSGLGAFGQSIGQSGANFNNSFGSSMGKGMGSMMGG